MEEVTLEEGQKLTDLFKEGDEIQAKVIKTDDGDGGILLSKKKLEINEQWNEISEALENKSIITVKVIRQVNGGVIAATKKLPVLFRFLSCRISLSKTQMNLSDRFSM